MELFKLVKMVMEHLCQDKVTDFKVGSLLDMSRQYTHFWKAGYQGLGLKHYRILLDKTDIPPALLFDILLGKQSAAEAFDIYCISQYSANCKNQDFYLSIRGNKKPTKKMVSELQRVIDRF